MLSSEVVRRQRRTSRGARRTALRGLFGPATLAATAVASATIYLLAFVRPYSLLSLYRRPLLDLFGLSQGNPKTPAMLLLAFLALGALYWLAWRVVERTGGRVLWLIVVAGAVTFGIVLLFLYPVGAADIFDNIMHGRILGIYGGDPFSLVAADFPQDPFYPYVGWKRSPSAYGPGWELVAALTARFAGNGVVANILAFKFLGALFLAASAALVVAILRRAAPGRALQALLLLTWNPLLLYETLGNGHNDIALAFWILAAIWAMVARRYTVAILALIVGGLFKFVPVLLLPAASLVALRALPGRRARLRFLVITSIAALLLVVLAYAPFWDGVETLSLSRRAKLLTSSLPATVYVVLAPEIGEQRAELLVGRGAAALTAGFALWQAVRASRDPSWLGFAQASFATLMFYLLVTCLFFQPWYAIWPLAVAVLLPAGFLFRLGILFSFAVLAKPLIFDPMFVWPRPFPPRVWRELRLGPSVMALPWLYVLISFWLSRRGRPR